MTKNYDLLILNNCPAFYKVNLYNKLNEKVKICVVFIGFSDQVNMNVDEREYSFDYFFLTREHVDRRNYFVALFKLFKITNRINFKKIIYGGYIEKEFVTLSFYISKQKNILQTESASESRITGFKSIVKSIMLKRYSSALVSGFAHKNVLLNLGFSGEITITSGVGLMNYKERTRTDDSTNRPSLRFIYVGRLIEKKNVEFLIKVFNVNGLPLTIVGGGVQEQYLKSIALDNIVFKGHVRNIDLGAMYCEHDVFILPSLIEPWGLVVEEALFHGCVLLLSEKVGCSQELLTDLGTGRLFNPNDKLSFEAGVSDVIKNYNQYKNRVDMVNFRDKDRSQINSYINQIR